MTAETPDITEICRSSGLNFGYRAAAKIDSQDAEIEQLRALLAAKREATIEECAKIAKAMREKHGSPTGDAYSNGVWDQGVRIEQAIRALSPRRDER